MIVKTAVKQYQTENEIFLQSGIYIAYLDHNDNIEEKFGNTVAYAKVKRIDVHENQDAVTIYF